MFDGLGHLALVFGAEAGALGGDNFKLPRGKFTENFDVFVVNGVNFVLAGDTRHKHFVKLKFKGQNSK